MSLTDIIVNIVMGAVNLVLAIPRFFMWLYEMSIAGATAADNAPALEAMQAELKDQKLLRAFDKALKSVDDIVAAAPQIVESSKDAKITDNAQKFLDYVSAKAAAPEYPYDPFSIDFALFGKSSDLFFMVFALMLILWIGGFFRRDIWRVSYTSINAFNSTLGKLAAWFALVMAMMQIMIIFLQQVFRANGFPLSVFGLELIPSADVLSMPWFATELMFFNAIIIAFAFAYTFVDGGHVRVDLVYAAFGRRGRACLDLIGTVIFLLPSMVMLWWLSWHLAINKIMTVTNFNHLTTQMLTRDIDGRIAGSSGFKGWSWTVSNGEAFSGVPLYFFLLLVLAGLMIIQGIGYALECTDKMVSNDLDDEPDAADAAPIH